MELSGGVTAEPAYVVHCSIMWPAQAQVQSPRVSFNIMGQLVTFFSKSSFAGGGGTALLGIYFASISVRGSCLAANFPSLTFWPLGRVCTARGIVNSFAA